MAPTMESKEAVEGEVVITKDFFFDRVGLPIPVMTPNGGGGDPMPYDPECLPSQALAVSEQFELLFVAHSSGFLVAETWQMMLVMMFNMTTEGQSAQRWCALDVPVGRVRLLLLSPDSSTIAACVGGTVNFFSVESLIDGEQRPFLSRTIDGGSSVKDMRWLNEVSNILLTSCGNLYLGRTNGFLKFLKYNVDAVDCSPRFDYIAVVRDAELSILSSKLNKESHIALSLQSWTGNSDEFIVKVDSLKWVCPDRIVLGCFQLTSDGMERSYLLLVISLTVSEILPVGETTSTQLSLSNVYVQSFREVFPGIVEDIMPAGSGPHLFFSCLEKHELAIAANRKNVDQHIVLFDWRRREQMALVYIDRDRWLPRIELQENGDDNSILGFCTERTPMEYWLWSVGGDCPNIKIPQRYPICTLWCLSLEGKLSAFIVARKRKRIPATESILDNQI